MENTYNFPEGTTIKNIQENGKDFYSISYVSEETTETPFGVMPIRSFSTGNYDMGVTIETFTQTLESNGYNFETNTWQ